jgi:hypothetical protein
VNYNPYLVGNVYLGTTSQQLNVFGLITVILSIFLMALFIGLIMRSGHNYSVQDTEAHSESFAGIIREGHGGMTMFLWIWFIFLFVWTVVYFAESAPQFAIWFAY